MNRKFSDEQLERIAEKLLRDFAPDDETVAEMAESPRLWWNVRNAIETEKTRRRRSRLAAFRPLALAFGALAVFVCFTLAALFLNFAESPDSTSLQQKTVQNPSVEVVETPAAARSVSPEIDSDKTEISKIPVSEKSLKSKSRARARFGAKNQTRENSTKQIFKSSKKEISIKPPEETKTDFIALSYAAATDSGQIVRVKVPSSMMVSLGVRTTVEKQSELVNAEVVIGDDGLARAIRFIR